MNKALYFQVVGSALGAIGLFTNLDNPKNIILFASVMICSYMIFHSTLSPMTNILSYFMADEKAKLDALQKGDEQ